MHSCSARFRLVGLLMLYGRRVLVKKIVARSRATGVKLMLLSGVNYFSRSATIISPV
jgi:hypothetical protein